MTGATAPAAVHATGLGFRFRTRGSWALRDCELTLPAGRVAALVGRNGAGKSTLLHLASGLIAPAEGDLRVLGASPGAAAIRDRVALLAQDKPLYPRFTVADTLRLGREFNHEWDQAAAERVVRAGDIPLTDRVGRLSAGQRTRVALALVLGRRPELLLLDEPLADLDPLVREEITATLMEEAAERRVTIVLSSHVLPDVEEVCDWVVLLREGRVGLCADVDELREAHTVLTGHADAAGALDEHSVVHRRTSGRQITALVRTRGPVRGDWIAERPRLEEILLGHLRAPSADATVTVTATATATATGNDTREEVA
ncbi:ATP-binding cassette domain-containing protein [Streptomyces sp. NPDC048639]|uniref:ATP-binding cassette domain-containing protein n=1 Tax=Streptomyces sp. NPDC048639 TaxID=3365581 RepID=UPI003718AED1